MVLHVLDDERAIGRVVGELFCAFVRAQPRAVLGLATGASPLLTYQYVAEQALRGRVDFSCVRTFNLDEYCGLAPAHPCSYRYFMRQHLFEAVGIPANHTGFLDGNATCAADESALFQQKIAAAGGIDLQLLGIGQNGHIGFNEPADFFSDAAHVVALSESTLRANSRYFCDAPMPSHAFTMGVLQILQARSIVLIAVGAQKAEAVHRMLRGPVTPQCPASILQTHPCATVFVDRAAAARVCA